MTKKKNSPELFDPPEPAWEILARSLDITPEKARDALQGLIRNGYAIAPREPTNAMLTAYMCSYGQNPSNRESVMTAMAKARVRWAAMVKAGIAVSLTRNRRGTKSFTRTSPEGKALAQQIGGIARARALTPARRSEIARKAAQTRWEKKGD